MSVAITTQNAACSSVELDCTRSRSNGNRTNLFRSHRTLQQTTAHLLQQQILQLDLKRKRYLASQTVGMYVLDTVQKPEHKTQKRKSERRALACNNKLGGSGPNCMCRGKRVDAVDACTAGDVKSGLRDVQALGACRTLDQEERRRG